MKNILLVGLFFFSCKPKKCVSFTFEERIQHNFVTIVLPYRVLDSIPKMMNLLSLSLEATIQRCNKHLPTSYASQNWGLSDSFVQKVLCEHWPIKAKVEGVEMQFNLEFKGNAVQENDSIVIAVRRLSLPQDSAFFSIGHRVAQ